MDEQTTFDKILQSALTSMIDHPQHDLNLRYRQAIYRHLGQSASTLLAMHTLQYVLPVWKTARPDDYLPHAILYQLEQLIQGNTDAQSVCDATTNEFLDTYMDTLVSEHGWSPALEVGYASFAALGVAVGDERLSSIATTEGMENADLDICDYDTALYAAIAYAGGASWKPHSEPQQRHQFWNWWLTMAVPLAAKDHSPIFQSTPVPLPQPPQLARDKLLAQERYEFTDTFVIDTVLPLVQIVVPIEIIVFEATPEQAGMITTILNIPWLHDVPEATRELLDVMFHYALIDGATMVRSQSHSIEIEFVVQGLELSTPLQAFSRTQVQGLCKQLQEQLPHHIQQWMMSVFKMIEGVKP